MLTSGPPRARIARSSSGRGAHPAVSTSAARIAGTLPFEVAAGRDSPSLGASVPLRLPVAVLCAACLAACMRTAAPPPAPTTPKDVRVVELENGFVPVRLEAPGHLALRGERDDPRCRHGRGHLSPQLGAAQGTPPAARRYRATGPGE